MRDQRGAGRWPARERQASGLPHGNKRTETRKVSHADLRIPVRRLRTQLRRVSVDVGGAAEEVPKVRQEKAGAASIGGDAILFKGSGFYETDYRSESYKKAAKAKADAAKPAATASDSSTGKTDSATPRKGGGGQD